MTVGEHCPVSHYIRIHTENRVVDQDFSGEERTPSGGDVTIGKNTWIGAFTLVTQDTEIGEDSVIGASAVVSRDIPPHSIAVGAPAKVIQFKSHVDEETAVNLVEEYWSSLSPSLQAEFEKG